MVSIFGRKPSDNVVDARTGGGEGMSGAAMAGLGVVGAAGAAAVSLGMAGVDQTLCWLNMGPCEIAEERQVELDQLAAVILGDTERIWGAEFSARGATYQPATLVLHDSPQNSACGLVNEGQGPSYCPEDGQIFVDLAYFDGIATAEGVVGDFAPTFIIAHEVAHHVQTQTGDFDRFLDAILDDSGEPINQMQIRLELQADCLAGVWTKRADAEFGLLEDGDIEEGITAATVFGADAVQERVIGFVIESGFTHGTSEQRVRWFRAGLDGGERSACDTWSPAFDAL